MSRGTKLQEMEQSKTAVNANAAPADAMPKANASGVVAPGNTAQVEDLGGPTPQNYKPDDDIFLYKTMGDFGQILSFFATYNDKRQGAQNRSFNEMDYNPIFTSFDRISAVISSMFNKSTILETTSGKKNNLKVSDFKYFLLIKFLIKIFAHL